MDANATLVIATLGWAVTIYVSRWNINRQERRAVLEGRRARLVALYTPLLELSRKLLDTGEELVQGGWDAEAAAAVKQLQSDLVAATDRLAIEPEAQPTSLYVITLRLAVAHLHHSIVDAGTVTIDGRVQARKFYLDEQKLEVSSIENVLKDIEGKPWLFWVSVVMRTSRKSLRKRLDRIAEHLQKEGEDAEKCWSEALPRIKEDLEKLQKARSALEEGIREDLSQLDDLTYRLTIRERWLRDRRYTTSRKRAEALFPLTKEERRARVGR